MWQLVGELGGVTSRLWWDRESAIATPAGKPTVAATAFAGALSTELVFAPPRDPEFKGMVERSNGYFKSSFLPGRQFTSPQDFNAQISDWLVKANARTVRTLAARPIDLVAEDREKMQPLPAVAPTTGFRISTRLARDYYIRLDSVDYSVDPRFINRIVEVVADLEKVTVTCAGELAASHRRSWARRQTITDPAHVEQAKVLRREYWKRHHRQAGRAQHEPAVRQLTDFDLLYGVDFDSASEVPA